MQRVLAKQVHKKKKTEEVLQRYYQLYSLKHLVMPEALLLGTELTFQLWWGSDFLLCHPDAPLV